MQNQTKHIRIYLSANLKGMETINVAVKFLISDIPLSNQSLCYSCGYSLHELPLEILSTIIHILHLDHVFFYKKKLIIIFFKFKNKSLAERDCAAFEKLKKKKNTFKFNFISLLLSRHPYKLMSQNYKKYFYL